MKLINEHIEVVTGDCVEFTPVTITIKSFEMARIFAAMSGAMAIGQVGRAAKTEHNHALTVELDMANWKMYDVLHSVIKDDYGHLDIR